MSTLPRPAGIAGLLSTSTQSPATAGLVAAIPAELVKWKFHVIDAADVQIDSVWWGWGEGNQSPWPSRIMPLYDAEGYRKWKDQGVDIAAIFAEESKKRGLEAFYNFRINGSDNDLGPFRRIPMKLKHPDWLIHTWPGPVGLWNFAIPEVRHLQVEHSARDRRAVRLRRHLTGFRPSVSRPAPGQSLGQSRQDDRLSTPVPLDHPGSGSSTRTPPACRGLESRRTWKAATLTAWISKPGSARGWWTCWLWAFAVSTWILPPFAASPPAPTSSSTPASTTITPRMATPHPRLTFIAPWRPTGGGKARTASRPSTSTMPRISPTARFGKPTYRPTANWAAPETLHVARTSVFVVQRRGGGHGPTVIPNPEDWTTPRWMYFNTNMLAPLPAPLANDGKADTLLTIAVADDVTSDREHLEEIALRVLLSDPSAQDLPKDQRLPEVTVATIGHPGGRLVNTPAAKGIENLIEARLNNAHLGQPRPEDGWLVFAKLPPELFAVGPNLVGLRLTTSRPDRDDPILIEKLEVEVRYRQR